MTITARHSQSPKRIGAVHKTARRRRPARFGCDRSGFYAAASWRVDTDSCWQELGVSRDDMGSLERNSGWGRPANSGQPNSSTMRTSRQHIYRLSERYRQDGLDAVDPRSRRPASNPNAVADEVIKAIVTLRETLTAQGLDAGPATLQWHLARQQLSVPSTSTIRRILHHHGPITPQLRKRPRSSYLRFEAEQPNECWQSDFTHWALADGTDTEILNWLDDHSRYLMACTAYHRVAGPRCGRQLHSHRRPARTACIHPDRQRIGLDLTIHPRPQRLRTPHRQPGHHRKERTPRPPPNPGQDRTLPPNPQTLADPAPPPSTTYRRCSTTCATSTTPNAHTAPITPDTPPNRPTSPAPKPLPHHQRRTLPHPPRHRRPIRQTNPALRQPTPPPRHRHHSRTHTRRHPDHHNHRHRHQQTRPPPHRQPPHRPQPQLLEQPTEKPRPMAGAIRNR